jgi:hypothetical protein
VRLWTVHPRYLDVQGLTAAWREALLAQKVLQGLTRGYVHHPQLARFQATRTPVRAIGALLTGILDEATRRGYRFDASKIVERGYRGTLTATDGQLGYEWMHLKRKLRGRAPEAYLLVRSQRIPDPHPLFRIVPGPVAPWERR